MKKYSQRFELLAKALPGKDISENLKSSDSEELRECLEDLATYNREYEDVTKDNQTVIDLYQAVLGKTFAILPMDNYRADYCGKDSANNLAITSGESNLVICIARFENHDFAVAGKINGPEIDITGIQTIDGDYVIPVEECAFLCNKAELVKKYPPNAEGTFTGELQGSYLRKSK